MMADGVAKLLRWTLVIGIALTAVALVFLLLIANQKPTDDSRIVRAPAQRENPLSSNAKFLVPPERVPRDYQQAEKAPPITLVPNRWQSVPEFRGAIAGPGADVDGVPAGDRRALAETIDGFLEAWETYTPSSWETFRTYKEALGPYVAQGSLSDIADRVDNHQPERVCPKPTCTVGSEWDFPQTYEAMTVRSFDGNRAYVTTAGPVILRAFEPTDPFDGNRFLRFYGILLEKQGSTWKVTRAAADTGEVVL